MDIKEKLNEIKKKYGILRVEIDGDYVELKPPVSFYEGLLLISSEYANDQKEATKRLSEYIFKEFPSIIAKDLNISLDEAKLLFMEYGEQFTQAFLNAVSKKKIKM